MSPFLKSVLALAIWCFGTAREGAVAAPGPEKPSEAAIQEWIQQLRDPQDSVRKAAAAKLELIPEALPALRKAAESRDNVLQWNAEKVLREALLRKARRMAEDYPIDLFLDRFMRVDEPFDEEAYWRVSAEIAGRLVDHELRQFHHMPKGIFDRMAVGNFIHYREQLPVPILGPHDPAPTRSHYGPIRQQTLNLPERTLNFGLLVIPGCIRGSHLDHTIVFAGDSVRIQTSPDMSIVVADGDVEAGSIKYTLIVAHGSVKARYGDIENSVVVAGGKVQHLAAGRSARDSILREECKDSLGWVRFFEIADAGVEVAPAEGGLKVRSVVRDQPPAKAGLMPGDVITSIDKTSVNDAEQFRRLLRRGVAAGRVSLTIQRMGKPLDMSVSFADWEPAARKK